MMLEFPKCPKCKVSILLPLSDYGNEAGGSILYKAWVCVDTRCAWTLRIDRGQVSYTRS